LLCRLGKYVENHNGVSIDVINNPPGFRLILYAKFVASLADGRHRARMGQCDILSALQAAQKTPASIRASAENGGVFISPCSQNSSFSGIRIRQYMSIMTYYQY